MSQKIINNCKKKLKNCKKCKGMLHIDLGDNNSKRCQCYYDQVFLDSYQKAGVKEGYIKYEISRKLRDHFRKHETVAVVSANSKELQEYGHSGCYLACKYGKSSRIFTDHKVIDYLFDKNRGENFFDLFMTPKFIVLEIGMTHNKDFIGGHFLSLIRMRERENKETLILLPSMDCITNKYKDTALNSYIFDELKDLEVLINLT